MNGMNEIWSRNSHSMGRKILNLSFENQNLSFRLKSEVLKAILPKEKIIFETRISDFMEKILNIQTESSTKPTFNPAIAHKRKEKDVMKLLMSDYKVTQNKQDPYDFTVEFEGPKSSLYEGGRWSVHVWLPPTYPFKSPSIGFNNRIFHPNVDESSGAVCLDVINQAWSPMFDLINIFDTFLPQLLLYPNPTDPLNPEAAFLMIKFPKKYDEKVKESVNKYARVGQKVDSVIEIEKNEADDDAEIDEDAAMEDEKVSMSSVSELSETSNIEIME